MTGRKTKPNEITNEQWIEAIKKLDEIYLVLVIGDPKENKPGVLERLRMAEGYIDTQKKLIWAILLAAIGDIAVRLMGFINSVQAASK